MKTQNPPKKKLPRKITPKKEKAYPDKWVVLGESNHYKILKLKNKDHEDKYAGYTYKIYTNYHKALLEKKRRTEMSLKIANRNLKSLYKTLTILNGILLLTQEELKSVGTES